MRNLHLALRMTFDAFLLLGICFLVAYLFHFLYIRRLGAFPVQVTQIFQTYVLMCAIGLPMVNTNLYMFARLNFHFAEANLFSENFLKFLSESLT